MAVREEEERVDMSSVAAVSRDEVLLLSLLPNHHDMLGMLGVLLNLLECVDVVSS